VAPSILSYGCNSVVGRWFALTVRSRHEKAVAAVLRNKSLEGFLPLYRARRRWSDRIQEVHLPLFPGYVFCNFEVAERMRVLTIPSVTGIVGFAGQPASISDEEIGAVQKLVASGLPIGPWPFLKVGQAIRITRGALRDVDGILLQLKDSIRVVVSVQLLQRSVAVTIDRDMISPVGNHFCAGR
jgi:transcriptional antiterminator NusG